MKKLKSNLVCNIALFVIATLFITLFAKGSSPLYKYTYGYDNSIFMYVGKAMKNGYIPYRDLYEIKGPILFLIQYLGQSLKEGKWGIFIIEIINFNIIVFLSFYIARLYVGRIKALLIVLISLIFWRYSYETFPTGNIVEAWSTMFSFVAVYIILAIKDKRLIHYIIIGMLAMCSALIRLTDCVIVGACIIYSFICMIKARDVKCLVKSILAILAGCLIILIPIVIYYAAHNALRDMVDAIILFSIKYSTFNKRVFEKRKLSYLIFAVAAALFSVFYKKDKDRGPLLLLMSLMCIAVFWIMGTVYEHYMALGIPCVILSLCIVMQIKSKWHILNAVILMMFIGFNYKYVIGAYACIKSDIAVLNDMSDEKPAEVLLSDKIKELIPQEDRCSVYTYNCYTVIPFLADTYSGSKYFVSQPQWSENKEMEDKIYNDFVRANDKYAVIKVNTARKLDDRIMNIIYNDYTELYSLDPYVLYMKK